VVVLYSGGRDSTCLLDLAARIAGLDRVTALHVNYGLRAAADQDQAHCEALAEHLGVPIVVETASASSPPRGNVQAWARAVRYELARELAVRAAGATVATGHTATDQVETILYRLASSPSRRALLGMTAGENGGVVRPLLRFTREQTAEYCTARGLEWREDESNESDAYARGRIRSALVPALRAVHPAAERNVLALADVLRDEGEVLDRIVDETLAGQDTIELARLRTLPRAIRRLVVQRLADAAAGGLAPGAARRADEIAGLHNGNALDIGSGIRATVESGVVRLGRTPPVD
jgi:tRNA(Ile)-lysidine synthase